MADQNLNVGITSSFDGRGTDEAAKGLHDTAAAGKDAAQAADTAKEAMVGLAESLGLLVSIAEIISFTKDATEEFYQNEKSMRAVDAAIQLYAKDATLAKKQTDEWIESMARLGGVSDDQVASALGRAYMLTGDLEQAQSRVGLAMDIATKYGVSFAEGLGILNAALNGQARQLKDFVPHIKDYTDAHEVSKVAIDFFEKSVRGATLATHDNALAADQAKVRWEQFKEKIGGEVAPVITKLREVFMTIPQTLTLISDLSVIWADTVKAKAGALAAFLKDVWNGPIAAYAAYAAETEAIETKRDADVRAAYALNLKEFQAGEKAKSEAAEQAARTRVQSNLTALAADKGFEGQRVYLVADFYKQQRLQYLSYQQWLQIQTKADLDAFQAAEFKKLQIEAQTRTVTEHLVAETLRKKKEAAKQELQMQKEIGDAALNLAGTIFGDTKEIAIASAIINTYEGATKALAQGGIYGAVLAAIVIAAGLAQVAKIASTEPATSGTGGGGAGFDDPSNDAAARQGGRRWAADMIREWSQGVSAGWSEGMRGGQTVTNNYDQSRRTTINANIQDPRNVETVKQLVRTIRMVDQNVLGQTTIAGRTR